MLSAEFIHNSDVPTYANPHPNGVLATWERGHGWVTEEPSAKKRRAKNLDFAGTSQDGGEVPYQLDTGRVLKAGTRSELRTDLLAVVNALRLTDRKLLRASVERLASHHEVTITELDALYKDGRGSHWKERRVEPRYLVSVRGQGENQVTLERAALAVEKTPQALNVALAKGRGTATFTVSDEIITVQRFVAGGHRA